MGFSHCVPSRWSPLHSAYLTMAPAVEKRAECLFQAQGGAEEPVIARSSPQVNQWWLPLWLFQHPPAIGGLQPGRWLVWPVPPKRCSCTPALKVTILELLDTVAKIQTKECLVSKPMWIPGVDVNFRYLRVFSGPLVQASKPLLGTAAGACGTVSRCATHVGKEATAASGRCRLQWFYILK